MNKKLNATFIDGIGKDAEIEQNAQGGLQSKSPAYLYLIDPDVLKNVIDSGGEYHGNVEMSIKFICDYMRGYKVQSLYNSMNCLEPEAVKRLILIGKVLQYGVTQSNGGKGYPVNNWRLIPREQHINHALIHLLALLAGDTQDDHLEHALCRMHMAIATKETEGFSYTEPFKS